jgi:hypothetical protein
LTIASVWKEAFEKLHRERRLPPHLKAILNAKRTRAQSVSPPDFYDEMLLFYFSSFSLLESDMNSFQISMRPKKL